MRFRILQANQDWKGATIRYVLFLLTFVMAFLTKEIAITLPLMVLIYDLYTFRANPRRDIRALAWPYVPGLAVATAYIAFAHAKLFSFLWGLLQGNGLRDLWTQLLTQAKVTSQYILLFLWPVGLTPDHHVVEARSLANLAVLASLGLIAALITVIFLTARSSSRVGKTISLGMAWFFITSLPTILIPLNLLMQEHRAYLPCVGLTMASGGVLAWIHAQLHGRALTVPPPKYMSQGSIFFVAFVSLILSGYSIQTVKRNLVWKDDLTLWSDAASKSASGFRAHNNLGAAYEARGRLEQAIQEYERAIKIEPDHFITYYNLGLAYFKQGKVNLAVTNFQKSLKINPIFPLTHYRLGIAYTSLNELQLAEQELKEAIRLDPTSIPAHSALGWVYASLGNFEQAELEFRKVMEAQPDSILAHTGLATVYNDQHQFEKAISEYQEVLRLDSKNVEAYYNLGLMFYELEKMDLAISAYQKGISIAPQDARLHTNLGNAYKRSGNMNEVLKAYREALRWDPNSPLAHYNMATTSDQLGRKAEAMDHYQQFLDLAALNPKYTKMVQFAKDRQRKLLAVGQKPKL
jgi:tetratricopeptide (TPR) repeat protein